MLQFFRKKAQSTFIQIIVVIIALVFVFWGVGANLSGDRQAAVVVNGEEISFQEFQRQYDQAYQRFADQFGGTVPKGLAESFGLKQQVITQLIQTSLLRQGAEAMGIYVSSEEIRLAIEEMVQFQTNSTFNMEQYKSVLAANRMAATKFENSMRIDRLSQVAAREVGNFAAIATDFEVEEIYSQMNEKIQLDFTKLSPETFIAKVEVNDELLAAWFEKEKDNYKTDPEIKVKYLAFTFEGVGNKIEIDNSKIEQYYQANLSDFQIPEQRKARHILLKAGENESEETHQDKRVIAEEVLTRAREGADFAELAKETSEGPTKESGGELGFFSQGQMVPPFDKAVFALAKGNISDIVKTRFGYHIILLEEINPATTRPLEAVKEQITRTLQRKEAETLAFQVANDAYEAIIGAGSLAKYAESEDSAEIVDTDFFAKDSAPEVLKDDAIFMEKAFTLNKGELSSLIKGQSGYAIFYADDITTPVVPEFEVIKKNLSEDYKAAESVKLAEAAAADFLKDLEGGLNFRETADQRALTVEDSGLLSRNAQNSDSTFPVALLEAAFTLSTEAPFPKEVGKDGEDFFVFNLVKREIPEMPEDSEEVATYRENLLNFKKQQVLSAWLKNLEGQAEIIQHQSLM